MIGFYPGGDQITIPHFDANGRFIGLRGRTMCVEEGEKYGKYRPVVINKNLYSTLIRKELLWPKKKL